MKLYHTNHTKELDEQTFWLFFYVVGNGEWISAGLPIPTVLIPLRHSYYIGYRIEGFFGTPRNRKFLADVKLRFIATLVREGATKVQDMGGLIDMSNKNNIHFYDAVYNLRDDIAPQLVSLPTQADENRDRVYSFLSAFGANTEDLLFDAIRYAIYDFVKANGKKCLTYEYVEQIARIKYEIIGSKKGWSTAKAKAKAIYRWVMENYNPGNGKNNWNYKRKMTDKEYEMTRRERAILNAKKIKESKRKMILNTLTGILKDEYLKPDGTWNVYKLSKDLKMSPKTIRKHIKELREEGIIK